ncbi:MAG: damage-control phosphatase ARMT1 family protein [Anaerolineales bacterium]
MDQNKPSDAWRPSAAIPDPLRGVEKDTFTEYSIRERFPNIIRQVLEDNQFPLVVETQLKELLEGIPDAPLPDLHNREAPDFQDWAAYFTPYRGLNWLQAPWFFVETYMYRLILEATDYFKDAPTGGLDPYLPQKRSSLEKSKQAARALCRRLYSEAEPAASESKTRRRAMLVKVIKANIWGNQADLSMWITEGQSSPNQANEDTHDSQLLVDDAERAADYLLRLNQPRVDFILDNVGLELIYDLCLADYLLRENIAGSVHFHLKFHPTYISDATIPDVHETIDDLSQDEHEQVRALAARLKASLKAGRFLLNTDLYWTSPLAGWQMPDRLRRELGKADLIISKGDANYRRLLGDRHWPFTTPFEDIVGYMPAALLAIRVLKSELIAGLEARQAEKTAQKDPKWLYSGEWGLIQFYLPQT